VASEAAVAVAKDVGCVLDTDETLTQGRDWAAEVAALKQKALRLERKLDEKTKGEETSALAKALEDEKTTRKREEASALAKAVEEAEKAKEVRVQAQKELVEAMASRKEVEASVREGAQATQGLHRRKGKPKDNVLLEKNKHGEAAEGADASSVRQRARLHFLAVASVVGMLGLSIPETVPCLGQPHWIARNL